MEWEGTAIFKGNTDMKFKNYFKTASFLLILSAFLSLMLTGELELPYTIIIILGLAAFLVQERIDFSRLSRGILMASIPFLALDFFVMSKDILLAFTHLIILLTTSRLLSLRTNSDFNQLYLLSFFDLLASSALTINLSFAFTFTVYLISATWVMLLFHIKKEVEERIPAEKERALEGTVNIPFFLGIGGVAVLSLVVTLAIFFVLPRAGIGLFSKQPGKTLKTTGFGDKVDFGQIGPVTLDPTTVMRVELPDYEKGLGTVYLRGTVLDFFNGVTWEKEEGKLSTISRYGNEFVISREAGPLVRQEIILDPLDSKVIFGMSRLVKLSGRFQTLYADGYGSVYLPGHPFSMFQYTAYSDVATPEDKELEVDTAPYAPEVLELYTRTPKLPETVSNLASSITAKAEGTYKKAIAIENHLKNNYSYTLSPKRDESLPPLEDFLFKNREGYCDHFSTAMVLLLRASGIPSRLVTGYLTTEWNDLGRFYIVRQKNAHSWVEVYFPSHGWVRFDPTAPAGGPAENIITSKMGRYIAYIRLKWDRYIINFTIQDQVNAAKEARRRTELGRETLLNLLKPLKFNIKKILAPAAILLASAIVIFILLRKSGFGGRMPLSGKVKSVAFYEEMLDLLAKREMIKTAGLTPREFAGELLLKKGEAYSGVMEITVAFEKVRYGEVELEREEMEGVRTAMETLKNRVS